MQKLLTMKEGVALTQQFLTALCRECRASFSKETLKEIEERYLKEFENGEHILQTWIKMRETLCGRWYYPTDLCNEAELFTIMKELCVYYIYHFQFNLKELLKFYFCMRYNPENYEKEHMLWEKIVSAAFKGKVNG